MLPSHGRVKFSYWATFVILMAASKVCCQRRPLIPMSVRSRDPDQLLAPSESTSLKKAAHLDERCPPSNICVSTIICPDVLQLLKKAVAKTQLREETISLGEGSVGKSSKDWLAVLLPPLDISTTLYTSKVHLRAIIFRMGFSNLNPGGNLFALSNSTLLIRDLTYDGLGPDAFFLKGEVSHQIRL